MERKPQPSFDRFSEKPARGRFSSGDRFADRGERRPRFGGDDRFADRGSRFDSDRGERRFDRNDRFGGERREGGFGGNRFGGERREGGFGGNRFGGERRFGGDRPAFRRFDRNEPRFADRSGPRAKAVETRRFADRQAFVQTQTVRLDADVAAYFSDPAAVNAALRQVKRRLRKWLRWKPTKKKWRLTTAATAAKPARPKPWKKLKKRPKRNRLRTVG